VYDTLQSRALAGNLLGDSPNRDVLVYLPPSYDRSPGRRYPVVYLLHGMTSKPVEWVDGTYQGFNLASAMDTLAAAGREYIVVMPDADNVLGGSFYMNSGVGGRWEDAIARELVRHVDARYRTIARRESRGLAGHSMGGFGVLFLAPRHADMFGAVYSMSACCLGLVGPMAPDSALWPRLAQKMSDTKKSDTTTARSDSGGPWRGDALSAAVVPVGARPPFRGYAGYLPFVPGAGGALVPDAKALATWRDRLPLERVDRDRDALSRLRALALDVGRSDDRMTPGVRAYAKALTRLGVRHTFEEYDGGHIDRVRDRFERAVLPFFARELRGTTTEPQSKPLSP
jgi:enterochelin esterase-like enzyme